MRRLIAMGIQVNKIISRHAFGDSPLPRSVRKPPVANLSRSPWLSTALFVALMVMLFAERKATGSQSHDWRHLHRYSLKNKHTKGLAMRGYHHGSRCVGDNSLSIRLPRIFGKSQWRKHWRAKTPLQHKARYQRLLSGHTSSHALRKYSRYLLLANLRGCRDCVHAERRRLI